MKINRFMAYCLFDGVGVLIGLLALLVTGGYADGSSNIGSIILYVIALILLIGIPTLVVKKKSGSGYFAKNWFKCLGVGFMVSLKLSLYIIIITIPLARKVKTEFYYSE